MKIKNILLIGGSGYIGSHLIDFLKDYEIYVTTHEDIFDSSKYILFNVNKKETYKNLLIKDLDLIVYLGSLIKGLDTHKISKEIINTNSFNYLNFLQFLVDHKVCTKFIYFSSMTVYGIDHNIPVTENSVLCPINIYGLSKLFAEFSTAFFSSGYNLNSVIFRIPGVFGGERKSGFIYNTIIRSIRNEDIIIAPSGLGFWETIEITDLSKIISSFIKSYSWQNKYDVFNIGYGRCIDIIECAKYIKSKLKSSSEIIIKGEKNYVDFFLSNEKIRKIVKCDYDFKLSLNRYIKSFKNEFRHR
jgi:nucleoside-diphosphate-sugar epimerase